ncbi:hypothetical protein L195_g027977 [Trifolium pratense]|uniref:Uncharacterized protein n=1 Tax=Trifolium pratense TaxID=57577 RepID=A0A2K3L0P0_TRIPR|nr:hypothetical protein L195_g027977 [Trifolium pratense]
MGVGVGFVLPPEQPLGLGDDFGCGFGKCQTRTHGHPLPSLLIHIDGLVTVEGCDKCGGSLSSPVGSVRTLVVWWEMDLKFQMVWLKSSSGGTVWLREWRDALTQVEDQDLTKLKELLLNVNLNPNSADRWRWSIGYAGLFSVKCCYKFLIQNDLAEAIHPRTLEAVKNM